MPYQAIQGFTCYNGINNGLNSHVENQARAGASPARRGRGHDPRDMGGSYNNGTITNDW